MIGCPLGWDGTLNEDVVDEGLRQKSPFPSYRFNHLDRSENVIFEKYEEQVS